MIDVVINEKSFEDISSTQLKHFISVVIAICEGSEKVSFIKPSTFSPFNDSPNFSKIFSEIDENHQYFFKSKINIAKSETTDIKFVVKIEDCEIVSLGCAIACNFDLCTVSAKTISVWQNSKINGVIETDNITINNIAEKTHIESAILSVPKLTFDKYVSSGADFWDRREKMFPNIIFCGKSENQIKKFSITNLKVLYDKLSKINIATQTISVENCDWQKEFTAIKATNSSATTKRKYSRDYEFNTPKGKKHFYWHVRLTWTDRIYFRYDEGDSVCYIGYIGTHLPI